MRSVPGNVHDLEPGPRYENEKSVLASRTTISAKEKLYSRLRLEGKAQVKRTGCHGFCQRCPLVVHPDGIFYSEVKPDDVPEIVESLLPDRKPVERSLKKIETSALFF